MKFTPGPWSIVPNIIETEWLITAQRSDTCRGYVASTAKTNDESEANARLIAAAPEMYEALSALKIYLEEDANLCICEEYRAVIEMAFSALAKVDKGEK